MDLEREILPYCVEHKSYKIKSYLIASNKNLIKSILSWNFTLIFLIFCFLAWPTNIENIIIKEWAHFKQFSAITKGEISIWIFCAIKYDFAFTISHMKRESSALIMQFCCAVIMHWPSWIDSKVPLHRNGRYSWLWWPPCPN